MTPVLRAEEHARAQTWNISTQSEAEEAEEIPVSLVFVEVAYPLVFCFVRLQPHYLVVSWHCSPTTFVLFGATVQLLLCFRKL